MKPYHYIAAACGTTFLMASLVACEPDATPRARDSAKWLTTFYGHYTVRGAWGLFGIEAENKNVEVYFNVPDKQASDLMKFDEESRKSFIALNACPPDREEVWSMLDTDGDIIVQTRRKGNTFARVSCKHQIKRPLS